MTGSASAAWADALGQWAIPDAILAQAPESPWHHDPASFAADGPLPRDARSTLRALEALEQAGSAPSTTGSAPSTTGSAPSTTGSATVLDVGCGGGRSSLVLVPPAAHITGVDASEVMLASFADSARAIGVSSTTVLGRWPDVADAVSAADVVVCHHVLYNVADLVAFLAALTNHARVRVVVELTMAHPMARLNPAWRHFWNIERPTRPTPDDAVAVMAEMGIAARLEHSERPSMAPDATDPTRQVALLRRRLCLPAARDAEIAELLATHNLDAPVDVATISWEGSAARV